MANGPKSKSLKALHTTEPLLSTAPHKSDPLWSSMVPTLLPSRPLYGPPAHSPTLAKMPISARQWTIGPFRRIRSSGLCLVSFRLPAVLWLVCVCVCVCSGVVMIKASGNLRVGFVDDVGKMLLKLCRINFRNV